MPKKIKMKEAQAAFTAPVKNEAKEREFWQKHDSSDILDWSKAKQVRFPNLKATFLFVFRFHF